MVKASTKVLVANWPKIIMLKTLLPSWAKLQQIEYFEDSRLRSLLHYLPVVHDTLSQSGTKICFGSTKKTQIVAQDVTLGTNVHHQSVRHTIQI
jgi:hypothetical protein